MSNINSIIASGGTPFDVKGALQGVQDLRFSEKRNALADITLQQAPKNIARTDRDDAQAQDAQMRALSIQSAQDFLAQYQVAGPEGASKVIESLPDNAFFAPLKQKWLAVKRTPGAEDDQAFWQESLQNAKQVAAMGGQQQGEGFSLAKNAVRFDAAGNQIASNIQAEPAPTASDSQRQRDDEINDLIPQFISQGMDSNQARVAAVNVRDKNIKLEFNPKTGVLVKTNLVTNKSEEIKIGGGEEVIPAPEPGQTLYDLIPAATGPVAGITAKTAAALSVFGIDTDEASTGAQQTFRTHTQSLIRALAINPRFPVAEMERIKEEISIQPSMFQGAGTLRKKINSLDESLRLRLEQAERDANDPNLNEDTRKSQGANASALKNFLTILGGNQKPDETTSRIEAIEARLEVLRNQ